MKSHRPGGIVATMRIHRSLALLAVLIASPAWCETVVRVDAGERGKHRIPEYITGKFAEHLFWNIYNGMSAQVLRNPTFAAWPFWTGQQDRDGRPKWHFEEERIAADIRSGARRFGWPDREIDRLVESRADALAHWWVKVGDRGAVKTSPDAGWYGGRAQRVEVNQAGQGIAQWTHLPLHRERKFEYQVVVRSPDLQSMTIELMAAGETQPVAAAKIAGITRQWQSFSGNVELPADAPKEASYRVSLVADGPGQFVVGRVLLWPADHIKGADSDVVRLLKESNLPILRWPGGNFVSGYRWEEGVGPVEQRPTVPNWAWEGLEPNLFGTDEFIAFCRAVGCEPMICVNAGDGTPEEAARWVEYCNGSVNTPMGARRAANGHREPYRIRYWEVGNELWGSWQVHWTTAAGNADRYRQFSEAMLRVDPSITLYACGAPVLWGRDWNLTLFRKAGDILMRTTDHPLIGGDVPLSTEPLDVYRDFMAVPLILENKWRQLEQDMRAAGIKDPKLAVTELQLFAHLGPGGGEAKLNRGNLVNPATQAEAVYDTLIYHASVRLLPFVEMVTHSATVNHGGGLRKERERVYANPCHHAQAAFAAFAGATPVPAEVAGPEEQAPFVLPDIQRARSDLRFARVGALAAIAKDGSLLVSLAHRGTGAAEEVTIRVSGRSISGEAEVWTLAADRPWAANSLGAPDAVAPRVTTANVEDGVVKVQLPAYGVMRLRLR